MKNHAFSIILIMIVLMLVGAACIPLLNVQYNPIQENRSLTVSFSGSGSARVIETEVTSVIGEHTRQLIPGRRKHITEFQEGYGYGDHAV